MNEKIYSVTVIMSTYNGEKYIDELMNSVIAQKNVDLNLFVRDDGSKDGTVKLLEKYKSKFDNFIVVRGNNIGANASFYEASKLALESPFRTEFYAFCDQDDIWLEDKLITAINILQNYNMTEPALYFSNLMMVDKENNQLLGMLLDDRAISKSKENAMSALFTYGCTCVFNHKALEAFTRISDSRKYIYFDDWMFAVCVFNGSVYYDSESHIRYRQTGENVSGEKKFGFGLWLQRFGKLFRLNKDMRIRESIAIELIDKFEKELTETDLKFLEMIADYRRKFSHKINLIFSKRMRTNSKMRNICTVGRIVIGHL